MCESNQHGSCHNTRCLHLIHSNKKQPVLMLLVQPVLLPMWHVKMCSAGQADTLTLSSTYYILKYCFCMQHIHLIYHFVPLCIRLVLRSACGSSQLRSYVYEKVQQINGHKHGDKRGWDWCSCTSCWKSTIRNWLQSRHRIDHLVECVHKGWVLSSSQGLISPSASVCCTSSPLSPLFCHLSSCPVR